MELIKNGRLMRALLCIALFTTQLVPAQDVPLSTWSATSPLAEARADGCAIRLDDGRILIAGGTGINGPLASAELYLSTGSFMAAAPMAASRTSQTCTLLTDGRVLVAGGSDDGSAELYDPRTDRWTPTANAGEPRSGATATRLRDGRVLIAGGSRSDGTALTTLETFRSVDGAITTLDTSLGQARFKFSAVLLADGKVMFAGGSNESKTALDATEIFDPADGSIKVGPILNIARASHSATLLDDGRVLIAGGSDGSYDLDSAELYLPGAGGFGLVEAKMQTARREHAAAFIPGNGGVLLAGGLAGDQTIAATELFQPVDGRFVRLGDLTAPRSGLTLAPLGDGNVLAAGGVNASGPQSTCGLLPTPGIQFTKNVYRPFDGIQVSGFGFVPGTKVTFTLELISNGAVSLANNRLVTASATAALPTGIKQLRTGFGPLNIMSTTGIDAGTTVLLIGQTSTGISVQTTVPIRNATSMQLVLPTLIYEGLNTQFSAMLSRQSANVPLAGTLSLSATPSIGFIMDGTSNTTIFADAANTTTTTLNTTGLSATLARPMPAIPATPFSVVASYSGDAANDPVSTTASFRAVSRAPTIQIANLPASPKVGTPFNLSASVQVAKGNPPFIPNGTVTFAFGGFLLGLAESTTVALPNFLLTGTRSFTPLTIGTMSFTAQYSGDTFFRPALTASAGTISVAKATPQFTLVSPPSSFACLTPLQLSAQLTFPPAIGLTSNIQVTVSPDFGDGTVRTLTGVAAPLTVTGAGRATATVNIPSLNTATRAVGLNFPGDLLIDPAFSATTVLSLQRTPITVQVTPLAAVNSTPTQLTFRLTPQASCDANFTGNLEVLDGQNPIIVVGVSQFLASLIEGGSVSLAFPLRVSLPSGTHSISARYSGDRVYLPATSPAVNVVVQ